ncbi:MOSC domain-containing protein [Paenibacillus sp. TRM 82003]|uniref:MOSC N-terminal beta barrel domain-containing protein n=1 Tax=Kineococcus sp. TRM81007 TaxID=2925831 RepID=UPI001F562014|nr:MOSC N-terminal beta barrel domain-containing protein [Kineococcus sp. TRM81007]MCI2238969.1 MOSC domain-containing protein [Kineococcus sp. TRM81007]MCI3924389.1 MOSC domain-containing protein [Paenibacillus sp. TRM 82003]
MQSPGVVDAGALVVQIAVFPVKSVAGLLPAAVEVGPEGLEGDRGFVLTAGGEPLRAKTTPQLRELELSGTPQAPLVSAPGAAPGDLRAVARFLGVDAPVQLHPAPGGARQVAAVHVVTTADRDAPGAGDSSRANLLLRPAAAALPPAAELAGALLEVGPVLLRLGRPPRHCAGSFAEVLRGGTVRTGDAARLRTRADGPGGAPG